MIDKTHADYKKYEKEFWALVDEENKEIGQYEEKNPLNKSRRDNGKSLIHKKIKKDSFSQIVENKSFFIVFKTNQYFISNPHPYELLSR